MTSQNAGYGLDFFPECVAIFHHVDAWCSVGAPLSACCPGGGSCRCVLTGAYACRLVWIMVGMPTPDHPADVHCVQCCGSSPSGQVPGRLSAVDLELAHGDERGLRRRPGRAPAMTGRSPASDSRRVVGHLARPAGSYPPPLAGGSRPGSRRTDQTAAHDPTRPLRRARPTSADRPCRRPHADPVAGHPHDPHRHEQSVAARQDRPTTPTCEKTAFRDGQWRAVK